MIPAGAKPLAALTRDITAELVGVVFDIDDTLTRGGRLEREAFAALWSLADAGLLLVAATGRPLGWADVLARHWPVAAVVAENGAGWVASNGRTHQAGYIVDEAIRAQHRTALEHLRAEVARDFPEIHPSQDNVARRADTAFDIGEYEHPSDTAIAGLTQRIRDRGLHSLRSSIHLHAMAVPYDKATGVRHAINHVLERKVVPGQWLFVGDSPNDAACFDAFPVSVGVANIVRHWQDLHHRPPFLTTADHGQGFAELASHLLGGRI